MNRSFCFIRLACPGCFVDRLLVALPMGGASNAWWPGEVGSLEEKEIYLLAIEVWGIVILNHRIMMISRHLF